MHNTLLYNLNNMFNTYDIIQIHNDMKSILYYVLMIASVIFMLSFIAGVCAFDVCEDYTKIDTLLENLQKNSFKVKVLYKNNKYMPIGYVLGKFHIGYVTINEHNKCHVTLWTTRCTFDTLMVSS